MRVAEQILPSNRGLGAQREVPRSGLWSEGEIVSSGMAASGRRSRAFAHQALRRPASTRPREGNRLKVSARYGTVMAGHSTKVPQ